MNNGSSGGGNNDDDDVGEIMRPPEETKKPDEGNNSGSSGEGIFSDGEQAEKIDKNKPLAILRQISLTTVCKK